MKYKIEKNTVQETLIIPLYAWKVCSELYPNLYRDETAVRLIDEIDYDFSEAEKNSRGLMQRFGSLEVAMRQNDLAFEVRDYLKNTHKWRWNSSVKWYAKGGLFDTASVIGIGEKGKEAALPLENRRTMKAIADSIVSSSGGTMGLSKEELTQAVAQGVAMAMSMNGGNNAPQYIMNSITLDGSEIAKAVSKAQRDQNSRFQPSPAY